MWEDEGAWNAYAGDAGGDSYNPYMGDASSGWDWSPSESGQQSQDWHYDYGQPDQGTSTYGSVSNMRAMDNYNWTPQYTPGATWNPSPTQMISGNPTTEELYNRLGGDQTGMQGATYYRGLPGMVNNPQLRDAEHYAAANQVANNQLMMANPITRLAGLSAAPAYSGLKYLAQNAPPWLQQYLPGYFTNASPPSWGEVWSGMKPFLR